MREDTEGRSQEPLLDRAHLDRQTAGDVELAAELLALFADQCRRLLPELQDASKPQLDRADLAHTLKGSALGIGASRVAARASSVETRLRAGGTDVQPEIAALAEDIAATLAEIARP